MDLRVEVYGRSGFELLEDQLEGLSKWHCEQQRRLLTASAAQETREQRLDARRRVDAIRRAQAALIARADEILERSSELVDRGPARSVLANRSEWMRHKLTLGLAEFGMTVVADVADGADALGLTVIEQPDLLILEDRLPSMTGLEVIRSVLELSPKTLIAVQVDDQDSVAAMLDAGAAAVFSRRIPPQLVVEQVVEQLRHHQPADTRLPARRSIRPRVRTPEPAVPVLPRRAAG